MTAQLDEQELSTLAQHRPELTGFCYRMLGSAQDADDAVQETMIRAWQAFDGFEGRSSVRSWLYRIATNVCLDALRARGRRALPMDLSAPVPAQTVPGAPLPESTWVGPITDAGIGLDAATDPAEQAVLRDSVRLAFVAALQHLPPRQRAVLLLREVLRWSAADVAELLDTTVASVNSALQRARATMATLDTEGSTDELGDHERELLRRYVQAFEAYDIEALVSLMHDDAVMSMPPLPIWLRGVEDLKGWYLGHGSGCSGSRLVPMQVNGNPGFAQYRRDPSGTHTAWSVQVVEIRDGRIAHVHHFLQEFGGGAFDQLGLPLTLD